MITSFSRHTFRAEPEAPSLLLLPFYALRALRSALHRRRWRRAAPFAHLNEHLRRDVGLPPLDDRSAGW